ncbi:MAG: M6 family metalloprotease domain-containing protein [candidate division WOR-3 bacterium]
MKKLLLCLVPFLVLAVPSNWKEVKTFYQPDGTPIQARLIGDEHYHFFEDLDGYVLVRDSEGWFTYAKKENGLLVPTEYIYGRSNPPYQPRLRPSAEAVAKLPQNKYKEINQYAIKVAQSEEKLRKLGKENASYEERSQILGLTGTNKLLCLLAAFSDSGFGWVASGETPAPAQERRHFWGIAFGDSVPPLVPDSSKYSMNNYYWEATYAKLKWTGDIDSIRNSGVTRASANSNTPAYVNAACQAANPYVDFSQFDLDNNGYVDHLFVIHPGKGEEESGDATDIWSASYSGYNYGPFDGKYVDRFVVIPENAKLGVFCHELFHQFANAPDLYDYDYDGNPVGDYCLMASGSWNGEPGGTKPSHMCGLLKLETDGTWPLTGGGWLPPAAVKDTSELVNSGKYFITQLDSQPGTTLTYERLYLVRNTALRDSNQMFILENRQKTGTYESGLPRSGLCIYHLDRRMTGAARLNDGPSSVRYYYYFHERNLVDPNWYYYCVSGLTRDSIVNFNPNDYFAPFAAEYGFINFDSLSIPNCGRNWRYNSPPSGWGPKITGISNSGYVMSFNVSGLAVPPTGPAIKVHSYSIKDPTTTGYTNNNNGVFDSGELDTLILTLYSSGANASGVQESLYTADPYISIVNPGRRTLGTMNNNTYASNQSNPYLVRIAFNTPPNYTTEFKYKVWATGYTDSASLFITINSPFIAWRFRPADVLSNHRLFLPMAIAVYNDTIFLSDGDSLPPLSGSWRLYKFNPNGTLNTNASLSGQSSYKGACDIAADGNIYWTRADSCIVTNRALSRLSGFRHYNSDWGSAAVKRVRGVTFPPANAPTNYMRDSLFVYWHVYYQSDGVTGVFEESLICESRPTSGSAVRRGAWVIPEGTAPPQDHWRNGRGLEHDGWRFWRVCLFTNEIYRARAPVSAGGSMDTIFSMKNPNHWGSYPGYDIDFQSKNSSGGEPHTPYARGNKFYLWTTNIESSDVMKLDVTPIVLPSPVKNVTAVRVAPNNYIIWDEKNYSGNPDTVEKVERYIIYRTFSLKPDEYGDSIGYFTARTGYARDTFVDYQPALRATTVYYRVSAVNWFGFIPGHSNRSPGVIGVEEQTCLPHRFFFYDITPNIINRRVIMKFEIPQDCKLSLKVYNAIGQSVRTLIDERRKAGIYSLIWNLRDDLNRLLPDGVYFVKFSTDSGYERTQKVILVR